MARCGDRKLRLLAWNIRQGGGVRVAAIAEAMAQHDADILVVSEYRGGAAAVRLRAALAALGYRYASGLTPPPGRNGVLIAARCRFRECGAIDPRVPEPYRMVGIELGRLRLCGVYMPNLKQKVPYWEALIAALALDLKRPALAIGDFNTCRAYIDEPGAIDATAHFMDKIEAIGFCDLWRRHYPEGRDFSWYSHRANGFRIDHAFLSPMLAAAADAVRYSHGERLAGLSDHSPLIVDLRV
ncbi:MAG TPA: endonuclease/exonuclease/phosphatase family protein [Stellaceae bacterium]|jgi:exonuclease III|nr:endonuclease/exonuclease/phosphatase family protein [Stellaceae bacterium]